MKIYQAVAVGVAVILAPVAQAEGLWGAIKDGANSAAKAVEKGANSVAGAASKGADAVNQSVNSTSELFDGDKSPAETRAMLDQTAGQSLQRLFGSQPAARAMFDRSVGYAVFDVRRVTALGVSGGGGRGVAVSMRDSGRTYMNMGTAGVGLGFGIGGFESQIVMLFETQAAFDNFITYGLDATGQMGARMGDDGDDQVMKFNDGKAIFLLTKKGWRISATAGGTRYWPDDSLN